MTYATNKELASSKKDFLVVIEPAIIVDSWTLSSGNIYYNDFSVSSEFLEYVTKVTKDGAALTLHTNSSVSNGEFYWDWDAKRLYINVGAAPSGFTMVVFFEIHMATSVISTFRDIEDSSSEVVYYNARIQSSSVPQIDNEDMLLFGTNSGSIKLINSDGAFYIYSGFRNKTIKIYHLIDGADNYKIFYRGKIQEFTIDDNFLTLNYRNFDYVFNQEFNSYLATGVDTTNGFFNTSDFLNLDTQYNEYAIRSVFGVVDDILPVGIDYNSTASTTVNRDWVVRADGTNAHALSKACLGTSTTTRLEFSGTHYFQVGDALTVEITGADEYTFVTARASSYVDVSPAITAPSGGELVNRSTIGYVKIRDENGAIYNLAYDRDYTEATFANNTLGFVLADNFEANHVGLTTFDPGSHKIFCRCYGKKHTTNDTEYGNMTDANLILLDIFSNYMKLDSSEYDSSTITALSTQALGLSIPEDLTTTFPTYREIINKIDISILGHIFINDSAKISYFLTAPMGTSTRTLTDTEKLSFSVKFDADDIYNKFKVSYARKEDYNGTGRSASSRVLKTSEIASYLHEEEKTFEADTYLIKSSEVDTIAERYQYAFEDWKTSYSTETKMQLAENVTNDIITISRKKLVGYNNDGELHTKDMKIMKIKKSLTEISIGADSQDNIEKNAGSW